MKILLLTVGVALVVFGCILVSKGLWIAAVPLGTGLYAMSEGLK